MDIKTLGIDLAKNVFQLCGMDGVGSVVLKKRLTRNELLPYLKKHIVSSCRILMEACGALITGTVNLRH